MTKIKFQYYFLVVCFLLICGCGQKQKEKNTDNKLNVVTTTGMIADAVKNIGKDSVNLMTLMGPGVDPHLYKATQGDLRRLQSAQVIFYNGLHLEGKMGEVFEKLERIKTVIPVTKNIDEQWLLQDSTFQGAFDPHIWFDVSLWKNAVKQVAETLKAKDPKNSSYYSQNLSIYLNALDTLHNWVKTEVATIPKEKRIMVTAHDAFNYFGEAYDIEVRGLQGISTLSEFGLKDRVDLVNYIVDKQIKAVFVETSVSGKNINAIVEGCRQKGHEIIIGGHLFSDAMGAEGTTEGTYMGMVKHNVSTIVSSLK